MKLPVANPNRPVQPLGRRDIDAPQRVANARAANVKYEGAGLQALGTLASGLGKTLGEVRNAEQDQEAQRQLLESQRNFQDRRAQRASGGMTQVNTLPNSIQSALPSETAQAQPDGTLSTTPVKEVPYWKVAIESYDSDAKAEKEAAMAGLPSQRAKDTFGPAWDKYIVGKRGAVAQGAARQAQAYYKAQSIQMATDAFLAGDPVAGEDIIKQRTGPPGSMFSPTEAAELVDTLRENRERGQFDEAMALGDIPAMEQYLAILRDPNYGQPGADGRPAGALEPDERLAAIKSLEDRRDGIRKDKETARAKSFEVIAGDLERAIYNGTATASTVETAYSRGVITASKRTQLLKAYDTRIKVQSDIADDDTSYSRALTGEYGLNPNASRTKKAADRALRARATPNTTGDMPSDYSPAAIQAAVKDATVTGVVPPLMFGWMAGANRSSNPAHVAAGARMYGYFADSDMRQQLGGMSEKDRAVLGMVDAFTRAGMDEGKAVTLARTNINLSPEAKLGFSKQFTADVAPDLDDELSSFMSSDNGWMDVSIMPTGAPTPTPAMRGAYYELTEKFYTLTNGDGDLAQKLAYQALRTTYATSEADGTARVMQYAPEQSYQATGGEMQEAFSMWSEANAMADDDLYLRSDAVTAREAPGEKTYEVWRLDDIDGLEPTGRRWWPGEHLPVIRKAAAAARLEEAKHLRFTIDDAYSTTTPIGMRPADKAAKPRPPKGFAQGEFVGF